MTDMISNAPAVPAPRRLWLRVASIGVAFSIVTMIACALIVADKARFGFLVNEWFLPIIWSGVTVGGILVFIAGLMLPRKMNWRVMILIIWGLIAITAPLFGIMFLGPWCVLAAMLPFVIAALVKLSREAA